MVRLLSLSRLKLSPSSSEVIRYVPYYFFIPASKITRGALTVRDFHALTTRRSRSMSCTTHIPFSMPDSMPFTAKTCPNFRRMEQLQILNFKKFKKVICEEQRILVITVTDNENNTQPSLIR